ncbi:hypothetical protein Poli38472_010546 [Pythium oligandrum]|uniref:Cyclin N-terminal domain-containing protein n=1 Tax=Pythium oligandrum TaxID=41045 RepID=A0A8K1FCB5_PYTOL|nr:hypothetical protein Poli38472_010546 [Pythium oligandrum]|eukprot:TMW55664.1 hypothetical protein Poli38472_010546 [Pythium oligandrum]
MADHAKWIFPAFRETILKRDADKSTAFALQTVSSTEDNMTWDIEQQLRWTTCAYIEDLASLMEMPAAPSVLAQLYVQRFYMLHSFAKHDRFLVATAALFLAGKTEEFPIKVRLMTECGMYLLLCKPKENEKTHRPASRKRKSVDGRPVDMSASIGNDPEAANAKHLDCLHALLEKIDVGEIEMTSARVLLFERILLQTLSFDLGIPQPFAYVPRCMEPLFALEAIHPSVSYDTVRSIAFLFLEDAIKSGLVLAFNCVELATGAVYLACLYRNHVSSNVATEKNEPWWSIWGMSAQQLEDVARGILWMYEDKDGKPRTGVSGDLKTLWDRFRPESNLPDLEYIKQLDADLTRH